MSVDATVGRQSSALSEEDQQRLITMWEFAVVLKQYLMALPRVRSWKEIAADTEGFLAAHREAMAIQPELHVQEIRLLSADDPVLRNTFSHDISRELQAMRPKKRNVSRTLKAIAGSRRERELTDIGSLITDVITSMQFLADTAEDVDRLQVWEIRSDMGSLVSLILERSLRKKIREAISTFRQQVEILTYIQQSIAGMAVIVYEKDRAQDEPGRIHLQASVQETNKLRMKGKLPENAESYASVSLRVVSKASFLS